eukprot:470038_1
MAESKLIYHCLNEDLIHCEINDIFIPHIHHTMDTNTTSTSDVSFVHTLSLKIQPNALHSLQMQNNTSRNKSQIENSINFESQITNRPVCSNNNSLSFLQQSIRNSNAQKHIEPPPVVLAHGYGSGGAVFLPSIPSIYSTMSKYNSIQHNVPSIHIIDWLGNGLSSRPTFNCENTSQTERFFVESFEEWRKAMNIQKMVLCGHSLGAYSTILYALKYPQHIAHLILISPVGLPQKPETDNNKSIQNRNLSVTLRLLIRFFKLLWDNGYTPSDILRYLGPKGKAFLGFVVEKRLFRLDDETEDSKTLKALLTHYLYNILAMNGGGSGEYALNKILMPGAWARDPLCLRMNDLRQFQKDYRFDIDFIYGSNDWMKSEHALQLKEDRVIDCGIHILNDCGHQLLLENYTDFGQLLATLIVKGQRQWLS